MMLRIDLISQMTFLCLKEERWTKTCDECVCNGGSNRQDPMTTANSLKECLDTCLSNPKCKGVEYWFGNFGCYQCLRPKSYGSYTDKTDLGYPPAVYQRGDV